VDNPTPAVDNCKKVVDNMSMEPDGPLRLAAQRQYHVLTSNSSKGDARIGRGDE
jgi:hypothetical protein